MTDEEYNHQLKLAAMVLRNALTLLDGVGNDDWYVDIENVHDDIIKRISG